MRLWIAALLSILPLTAGATELDQQHLRQLKEWREGAWLRGPRVASLALAPDIVHVPPVAAAGTVSFPLTTGSISADCSAPAYSFTGNTADGMCHSGSTVVVGFNAAGTLALSGTFGGLAALSNAVVTAASDGTNLGQTSLTSATYAEDVNAGANNVSFDLSATLPNAILTVVGAATNTTTFSDILNTFTAASLFTLRVIFGSAQDAANSIELNDVAGHITFEGSAADGVEGRLTAANPTVSDKLWTLPNNTGTVCLAEVNNSFTVAQTIQTGSFGSAVTLVANSGLNLNATNGFVDWGATIGGINARTAPTPDTLEFYTGTASEAIHVLQLGDVGFDHQNGPCGTAACTDPTVVVHSHNQATGEFTSVQAGAIVGTMTKALTESAATDVVRLGVASDTVRGGVIEYTVHANDGPSGGGGTWQTRGGGSFAFSVQNLSGTETCTMNPAAPDQTNDGNAATISGGTLTYAWTCTSAVDATVDLELNAVSSLAQTTLKVDYIVRVYGTGTVAGQ